MSEIKRVALNSFEAQSVSDKVKKKLSKTIRISVILPESNEDKCPEYNYKEQLALTKKRIRPTKDKDAKPETNGLDPFGEDDDDVKRIALEMEAKYGTGMIGKKRKGRKDDYADIGMGYDESDSFIDNTDGYDEIIPQNVTTLHGGFYINSGALEFKTDDEASQGAFSSSSENEDDERPAPHRKRIIETSDESDTASTAQVEKKPKMSTKNSMQLAIKKKLFSQNKIQIKKRQQGLPFKKTVKELIREKRDNPDVPAAPEQPAEVKLLPTPDSSEKKTSKDNNKPPSIITQNVQPSEADYDSNQNKADVTDNGDGKPTSNHDAAASNEGESSQEGNKGGEKFELVALPENLPSDIAETVHRIKRAAIDYKGEKKIKFFTDSVNASLLSLERKCKFLGKSSRVKVYEHLAYYIKCRKETLIRRAKVLVQEDEEKRLEDLTKRLKDVIDEVMPPLLANYQLESQKVLQKKFSKESVDNEENKALKLPRRKFIWNDEARKLLRDILNLKKKILILEGKQKDNLEEQMVLHLRTKVLPLWPDGWMYISNLKKVFNSMTDSSKLADRSQSKHSADGAAMPLSNSKDVADKSVVASYAKNPSSSSSKKSDIHRNNSFNELLESIKKDFLGTPEQTKKSAKADDGGRVDNCYANQHREKSASAASADFKHRHGADKSKDLSKHKHGDKVYVASDLSKHKPSDKLHYAKRDELAQPKQPNDVTANYSKHSKQPEVMNLSLDVHGSKRPTPVDDKEASKSLPRPNDVLKLPADSSVIVMNNRQAGVEEVVSDGASAAKEAHCHVMDLTEKGKVKAHLHHDARSFSYGGHEPARMELAPAATDRYSASPPFYHLEAKKNTIKPVVLDVASASAHKASKSSDAYAASPPFYAEAKLSGVEACASAVAAHKSCKSEGDDIQMVMENLKALQKLSASPVKSDSATGSPVSVIAFNKNFSSKSNPGQNAQQRGSVDKTEFPSGFQDEFQKQFIHSLQQMSANAAAASGKSNYRCS